MNFSWLCLVIFALFATVSANKCPAPFKTERGNCVVSRPVHGSCPHGSTYKTNINMCVYGGK